MIRIFVGCASGDDLESQAVLEYSLRKHASLPVEIIWMQQSRDPASPFFVGAPDGWNTKAWSTPFSGFRWAIPELCGFDGEAIYMDSDMIVMDDIAKLWAQKFEPGKVMMAKAAEQDAWRFCVAKWDCAAAKDHLLPTADLRLMRSGHNEMKRKFANAPFVQRFRGNWNCIDGEDYESLDDPDIKIIHYSAENSQPHLKYAVPRLEATGKKHWFDGATRQHWRSDLINLFDRTLAEAKAAGFPPERYAPAAPFGVYRIKSHANYAGNRWTK
jgi:hypothetical protein